MPRLEEFEGDERLLRRDAGRGAAVPATRWPSSAAATRPARRPLSWRTRAHRHLIVRERRPRREHVALSGRPRSSATRGSRFTLHTEVRELVGRPADWRGCVVEDSRTGERTTVAARDLFVFIGAAAGTRAGWPRRWRSTTAASSSPARGWRWTDRGERCSRPAGPASSPSATCAAARSSGSPRRSARARWPCRMVHEHLAKGEGFAYGRR